MMVTPDPVELIAASVGTAGLFLDFDGVLADITHVSHGAVVRPRVPALLSRLNSGLGRLAVISGRPIDFLVDMIPDEVDMVGLYGLEWRSNGDVQTLPQAEIWRGVVGELTREAVEMFGEELVEHKGLSLTIHYRNDQARADSMREWAEQRSLATGVEARAAKQSYELHPAIDCDKGTVIVELADSLDPVVFVGDDLGDLPGFDGLDVLASRGVTTLRIAVESDESPREIIERADRVVSGTEGVEALLTQLVDVLD